MTVIIERSVIDWPFVLAMGGGTFFGTLVALGLLWFFFRRYDS